MANSLEQVQQTFTTLDATYNMSLAACQTEDQREQLADKYAEAKEAWQTCVNQTLSDDDPDVAALTTTLITQNKQVEQSAAQMGDMNKVIENITDAIATGAQLLTKAGL